jgi:hypothetical protein
LREIAKYAGAHIYNNNDDVVYANKSYLCIHSDKPGKRTINLPTQANVYDLFDEDCKAEATTNFVIDLKGPDTKLFKIEPVEKKK